MSIFSNRLAGILPLIAIAATAHAQDVPTTEPMEEVLVVGQQSGPSLWKVSRGEHVLWILGTHSPLPKRMSWRADEVVKTIAQSQELLTGETVTANVGFFRGMTLLPSLIGIRKNPGGAKLSAMVPADLYARWLVLKGKYLPDDDAAESWRPIFAAFELYSKAIEATGLTWNRDVAKAVLRAAKKSALKITTPTYAMKLVKPRALIKEFKAAELTDLQCFARTLDRLETDLGQMRARANAWARGDVDALRRLTGVEQASACIDAVLKAQFAAERGFADIPARLEALWLAAAEKALANNASTFAILPVGEILRADGKVAKLRQKGYTVEEP